MRVNVDDKAHADPRFDRLGARLKMNRHEALGRCLRVWSFAYQARSPLMPVRDVDALSEVKGFAKAMIQVDLAEPKRGEKVRLRGVEERIQFLLVQDAKRAKANAARAALRDVPPGKSLDENSELRSVSPGTDPGRGPYSHAQSPALAPAQDHSPDAGARASRADTSSPPSPGGWRPPAGGKAEKLAAERVRRGEITEREVELCWAYCVSQGIDRDPPAKADARAAGLIKKQKHEATSAVHAEPSDTDYEAAL